MLTADWIAICDRTQSKRAAITCLMKFFELRQAEAVPVLESLGKWMKETYLTSLPKSDWQSAEL